MARKPRWRPQNQMCVLQRGFLAIDLHVINATGVNGIEILFGAAKRAVSACQLTPTKFVQIAMQTHEENIKRRKQGF